MKVKNLHRKQKIEVLSVVKVERRAASTPSPEVAVHIARARREFVESRNDFAERAAKAKALFPKTSRTVLLG